MQIIPLKVAKNLLTKLDVLDSEEKIKAKKLFKSDLMLLEKVLPILKNLNLYELRMFLLILKSASKRLYDKGEDQEILVYDSQFAALFNISTRTAYENALSAIKTFISLSDIQILSKVDKKEHNLLCYARYRDDIEAISVVLTDYFRDLLFAFKEREELKYGRILLQDICSLNSLYTLKLFLLLSVEAGKKIFISDKKFTFSLNIDKIYHILGVGEHYKETKEFVRRVIKPAIADINIYTALSVEYTKIYGEDKLIFNITAKDSSWKKEFYKEFFSEDYINTDGYGNLKEVDPAYIETDPEILNLSNQINAGKRISELLPCG